MAPSENMLAIYWDASAILSVLFTDKHSEPAQAWAKRKGVHLVSTLAYAETCAVIGRLKREAILSDILVEAAFEMLEQGPWRRLNAWPNWATLRLLSDKWPIRGADLWHLATVKGLQAQIPELGLLTFDVRLQRAGEGEGLGLPAR